MLIAIRHCLPAPAEVAWRELLSPAYTEALRAHMGTRVEELSAVREGGTLVRRERVHAPNALPAAVAAAMGADRIRYVQELRIDEETREIRWRITPELAADRVQAAGTFALRPHPQGCERVVEGEIRVAVPVFGKKIEKGIADELKRSYDSSAVFAREWLEKRQKES